MLRAQDKKSGDAPPFHPTGVEVATMVSQEGWSIEKKHKSAKNKERIRGGGVDIRLPVCECEIALSFPFSRNTTNNKTNGINKFCVGCVKICVFAACVL